MIFNRVRLDEIASQPWKNGGGVTRELLVWPDAGSWAMRLSVADIEQDGPFSMFAGIDRWFAVLSGNGVRLGSPTKAIRRDDDAWQFDGALAPDCKLIDGATRDLNLMIRRDVARGWMKRVGAGFEFPVTNFQPTLSHVTGSISGLFAVSGCTLRRAGSNAVDVEPMSLIWCSDEACDQPWRIVACESTSPAFAFQCVRLK